MPTAPMKYIARSVTARAMIVQTKDLSPPRRESKTAGTA